MILPDTDHNRAAVARVVAALQRKAVAKGLEAQSPESRAELAEQLADGELAFDIIDDHEARMGLSVADERAALTVLHVRAEGGDVPTYQEWLTVTYSAWLTVHGFPPESADDLLADGRAGRVKMTVGQIEWLAEFCRLWAYAD